MFSRTHKIQGAAMEPQGAAMEHCACVVSSDTTLESVVEMVIRPARAGRRVLLVHGGAIEGAQLELALYEAFEPERLPVALVHRSGEYSELRTALDELASIDADLEVVLTHTGAIGAAAEAETRLLDMLRQEPGARSLRCVFDATDALDNALDAVFGHATMTLEGICVPLTEDSGRAMGLGLLLETSNQADAVERASRRQAIADLDKELLARFDIRHRERCKHEHHVRNLKDELTRSQRETVAAQSTTEAITRQNLAVQEADGDLLLMLRAAASEAGLPLVLEDAEFRVIHWSEEPVPVPPSLAESLAPARLQRVIDGLEPGIPSLVRLGVPGAGARLVLRLGRQRCRGYLSILRCPLRWPAWLGHLLNLLEVPVVTALGYEQGLFRIEKDARSQLLLGVLHGTLSDSEAVQVGALLGWRPEMRRRLAFVLQGGADEPGGRCNPKIENLRRHAEHSSMLAEVIGENLAAILPDQEDAVDVLVDGNSSSQNLVVGLSEVVLSPAEASHALRQAEWAARIARETDRPLLRFEDLGVDRLLFQFHDDGEPDLLRPLHSLRESSEALNFDAVETVGIYLECGANVRNAAHQMHVHVNTLRYRLERIQKMSGLNLDDPKARFEIQLALRLATSREALRQSRESDLRTELGERA